MVLFPEVVLDFTVSDRCAAHIQEYVSYEGTQREIADRQEALRIQLQLPTRFMSIHNTDEHNWRSVIVRGFYNPDGSGIAPACSDDAERWDAFETARSWKLLVEQERERRPAVVDLRGVRPRAAAYSGREDGEGVRDILRVDTGSLAATCRPGHPMTAATTMVSRISSGSQRRCASANRRVEMLRPQVAAASSPDALSSSAEPNEQRVGNARLGEPLSTQDAAITRAAGEFSAFVATPRMLQGGS